MAKDKGITDKQSLAGMGESLVEAWLKSFSQVLRPVPLFEYAIDFFCRLLQNGKPSNNIFGVEVKSTNHFSDCYHEPIDKEIVEFWLIQPFPIFVVVYEQSSNSCYWISVEDNRTHWLNKLRNEKKSVTITIDRSRPMGKNQNAEFLKRVEEDIIRVNAGQGIAQFISKGYEGYAIGYIPTLRLSDSARKKICQRIQWGLNYLVKDSVMKNDPAEAYDLCRLLVDFDRGHYENFWMLAKICRMLGKTEDAKENYKMAIKTCKDDPNWDKKRLPNVPSIKEIIDIIETESLDLDNASIPGYNAL